MSETALKLIQEAKQKQSTWLSLNGLGIKEIPHEIEDLEFLKSLFLSNNEIRDVKALGKLKEISILDLSGNNIEDISPLAKIKNLKKVFLFNNKIKSLLPLLEIINNNIEVITSRLHIFYTKNGRKFRKDIPSIYGKRDDFR